MPHGMDAARRRHLVSWSARADAAVLDERPLGGERRRPGDPRHGDARFRAVLARDGVRLGDGADAALLRFARDSLDGRRPLRRHGGAGVLPVLRVPDERRHRGAQVPHRRAQRGHERRSRRRHVARPGRHAVDRLRGRGKGCGHELADGGRPGRASARSRCPRERACCSTRRSMRFTRTRRSW
jgi:hypothetical protein